MARVMIVDDEPGLRGLVKKQLKSAGHTTMEAENGKKFLEVLEDRDPADFPDLILMDINMPELDGWEAVKELRERDLAENVPIVMLTVEELTLAKVVREDLEELTGYIEKPFTKSELLDVLDRVVEKMENVRRKSANLRDEGVSEELVEKYREIGRREVLHGQLVERLTEMRENRPERRADIEDLLEGEKMALTLLELRKGVIERMAGLEEPEPDETSR